MKLYLSGVIECKNDFKEKGGLIDFVEFNKLHILQTFYDVKNGDEFYFDKCADFLMDSGAFSVMNSKAQRSKFNPLEYAKKYGEFVRKHNVDQFIELDIDGVFGIDVYKDCLHCLQDTSGKDPLRVFHMWRGKEYFQELTKAKDRICIGGIAIKHIKESDYVMFDWMLEEAHKNHCKVHGLGMGTAKNIRRYDFDSTDSASWLTSMQFGHMYRFNGHELCKYPGSEGCKEGEHLTRKFSAWRALKEWAEYSKYLDAF
jgi:hypothetical protein